MKIINLFNGPVYYSYANVSRVGRTLAKHEVSPELPTDRINDTLLQRDWKAGRIQVLMRPEEQLAAAETLQSLGLTVRAYSGIQSKAVTAEEAEANAPAPDPEKDTFLPGKTDEDPGAGSEDVSIPGPQVDPPSSEDTPDAEKAFAEPEAPADTEPTPEAPEPEAPEPEEPEPEEPADEEPPAGDATDATSDADTPDEPETTSKKKSSSKKKTTSKKKSSSKKKTTSRKKTRSEASDKTSDA